MGPTNKLKLSRVLLATAILLIVAFQSYWLNKIYQEEWLSLKKDTNSILRDVVYDIQLSRYKGDSLINKQKTAGNLFAMNMVNELRQQRAAVEKKTDSVQKDTAARVPRRALIHLRGGGPGFRFGGNRQGIFTAQDTGFSELTDPSSHFEIRNEDLPPSIARMLARRQAGNVRLPPAMDTSLLRRMSQSGMKIVVSFNDQVKDSTIIIKRNPPNVGSGITGAQKKNTVKKPAKATPKSFITRDKGPSEKAIVNWLIDGKALADTLSIPQLDSAYKKELNKAGIRIDFAIKKGKRDSTNWKDTLSTAKLVTSPRGVGLFPKYWYQAVFESPTGFLMKKISLQILFSLFLIAFTSVTFIFLYRNLLAQRKLTEIKNDFISNITHELKTPLATVSVAVEALRNFGGIQNPLRTKEYLDISAAELQRLSLLVDKVLKLSLFESKELELNKEKLDLKLLTEEVLNTMKLQFDTHHAKVELKIDGNYFTVLADRLHITSVIFNLLDNALKYSTGNPEITLHLQHQTDMVVLQVEDKGIGIPQDFKMKIFDKFFRVPTGNHHNIKGYGLGLSYVAHVIKQHNGTISVDSEPGRGSIFTLKLPIT
jgi:two-component system phosphate regulon sensor histidine kinase PhoR